MSTLVFFADLHDYIGATPFAKPKINPGDYCPSPLDRTQFTADQLSYLDTFFHTYNQSAHERREQLLDTAVDGCYNPLRIRVINQSLIDYLESKALGQEFVTLENIAKYHKIRKAKLVTQHQRITQRLHELTSASHRLIRSLT